MYFFTLVKLLLSLTREILFVQYVKQIYTSTEDLLLKKQFSYIIARHVSCLHHIDYDDIVFTGVIRLTRVVCHNSCILLYVIVNSLCPRVQANFFFA